MKNYLIILFWLMGLGLLKAQTSRIAILDFENTSGKVEYDALGKAISSMLITDLSNNIHPKKALFIERSQLNKLLDEHKLPKSKNFDANAAVSFGKTSGVNYVLVGSYLVMDGNCIFLSKLVDVETSKILFEKEISGKIESLLQLKSQLAEAIAIQLNNPISLDPLYKNQSTTIATINQYGKVLHTMDSGEIEKAEQMRGLFEETNPDFKYFKDLAEEISKLKMLVKEIKETLNDIIDPEIIAYDLINENREIQKAIKYLDYFNSKNNYADKYGDTKKLFVYHQKARAYYRLGDFKKSMDYYDSTLVLDPNYLSALDAKMALMMGGEFAGVSSNVKTLKPTEDYSKEIENCFFKFTNYGKKNITSFNPKIYRFPGFGGRESPCFNDPNSKECEFFNYRIRLPRQSGGLFNDLVDDPDLTDLTDHLIYPTNLYARYLVSKKQNSKAILILENCLFQEFEFLKGTSGRFKFFSTSNSIEIPMAKKDRSFNLLQAGVKRNYNEIAKNFKPIFKEHAPRQFTGDTWGGVPENNGFTDNVVLLSNLLISEKRYDDAISLLIGFKEIFASEISNGEEMYLIEKFKIVCNLYLLTEMAGVKNVNIRMECEKIYQKENGKILTSYGLKKITFEEFLNVLKEKYKEFHKNTDHEYGLKLILDTKFKQLN